MRKVIGIGETILDILFKENQIAAAVPGGSIFNGLLSLTRLGVPVSFVGELSEDKVGSLILDFMKQNGIETQHISRNTNQKSPISLAFLSDKEEPTLLYYKDYSNQKLYVDLPEINADDIVLFGSYYALNPELREKTKEILQQAKDNNAIIYYDPNFRNSHKAEALKLNSTIIENLEFADIVRGSIYDFENMYQLKDSLDIYRNKVAFYCSNFICTAGSEALDLYTSTLKKSYTPPSVTVISTLGAGDNFNAGIIYGLLKENIGREELYALSEEKWDKLIHYALLFSSEVCKDYSNSISQIFANQYLLEDTQQLLY